MYLKKKKKMENKLYTPTQNRLLLIVHNVSMFL